VSLTATIHHFAIKLSDVDRGVYETLELKVARHPSEAQDHLVTRVLAYCLEMTEGLSFSRGLAEPDEPALSVPATSPVRCAPGSTSARQTQRGGEIELYAIDRELVSGLAGRLERRMQFDLSVTDRHLFVSIAGATLSGAVERLALIT
jgi:uncharacterized protein YaeQ